MGGVGERKEGMLFLGDPSGERFLCWETQCWLLLPLSWPFFFFFRFLWWPVVVQEADGVRILPCSGWGVDCRTPSPPRPAVKEQTHWLQYTAVRKRWLQMISKTWFLCFQTKTIGGDASRQLSQSTGVYSSGYQISIWRGWEGRSGVNRMVVSEVSSQICKYSIPDKFK